MHRTSIFKKEQKSRINQIPRAGLIAGGIGVVGSALLLRRKKSAGSSGRWSEQIEQELAFDKGQAALMLEAADMAYGSPATAVAMMDFMARQRSPYRGKAQSRLTSLLLTVYPHISAQISAEAGRNRARQEGDDQLTAKLNYLEIEFLRYIHGTPGGRTTSLKKLSGRLEDLADTLSTRGSQRRQASARIILADIYLQQQRFDEANQEMSQALQLIQSFYTPQSASERQHEHIQS